MSIATQASCLRHYFFAWFIHLFLHCCRLRKRWKAAHQNPLCSLDRLQAAQAQRSACLGTSAEHSGKPRLSDPRGLRSPCFSWISCYFNLIQWRVILSSLLKELPPESILGRKTAHLCSTNRREAEELPASLWDRAARGSQGQKHSRTRDSPSWPSAEPRRGCLLSAPAADSQPCAQAANTRGEGCSPPTQVLQLLYGTCPH